MSVISGKWFVSTCRWCTWRSRYDTIFPILSISQVNKMLKKARKMLKPRKGRLTRRDQPWQYRWVSDYSRLVGPASIFWRIIFQFTLLMNSYLTRFGSNFIFHNETYWIFLQYPWSYGTNEDLFTPSEQKKLFPENAKNNNFDLGLKTALFTACPDNSVL